MLQVNTDLEKYEIQGFLAKQEMMAIAQYLSFCRVQLSARPMARLGRPAVATRHPPEPGPAWGVMTTAQSGDCMHFPLRVQTALMESSKTTF